MSDNFIEIKDGHAVLRVNPAIFPLDVVLMAAYVMIGKAHIFLDGNPNEEIKVSIFPDGSNDLKELAYEFNNQLLNYKVYLVQSERTADLRKILLARALLSNASDVNTEKDEGESCESEESKSDFDKFIEDTENLDFDSDPESITIPWYNKHKEESEEFFKAVEEKIGTKIVRG